MPQNQEEIEAKLAAYIDGELDADGRAEIEKHLQANPQHRTLIADLMKQRELVRSLPRANAPSEIAETLQGQLERSVLLGSGVDAGEDTSMRMSPWPHRGAIAAIVLLTAGLSFLVYKVLPSSKPSPELAVAPQSNAPSNAPATLSTEPPVAAPEQPVALADKNKDRVFTEKPSAEQTPAIVKEQNQVAAAAPSAAASSAAASSAAASSAAAPSVGPASNEVAAGGSSGDSGANKNAAGNAQAGNETAVALGPGAIGGKVGEGNFSNNNSAEPLQLKGAKQELGGAEKQPISPPECYVVVTTDDPASTDAQVRAFLIANQIRFEPRSADEQLSDRDYLQTAMAFRSKLTEGEANAATQPTTREAAVAAPSTQPAQQTVGNLVAQGEKLPTTGPSVGSAGTIAISLQRSATTAPSALTRGVGTDAKSQAKGEDFLGSGRVQGIGLPTTQPTTAEVSGGAVETLGSAATQPVVSGETSFYCPEVTPTQVQDLKSMLSRRAGQSAELVKVQIAAVDEEDVSLLKGAPTTQQVQTPADQRAGQQQVQQFGVGQLQGQTFLGQQAPQQAPTTQPAANPVSEGKTDLVIVMRERGGFATPQAAGTQPSPTGGVPNSPSATQPVEPGPGLKLP